MQELPFSDFGVKWFIDIIGKVTTWFSDGLAEGYDSLSNELFNTPLPSGQGVDVVFSAPTTAEEPWHTIYQSVVGGEVTLLALIVLFLTVQGRHFIRIFNVGTSFTDRKVKQKAWLGGVLIVAWYWMAILLLYFIKGLTVGILPDIAQVGSALKSLIPVALSNPVLTLTLAGIGSASMLLLKAIYFTRDILLYIYLYGMPIGIAIAYGGVPVISRIAKRLCLQFLPLAILPLPAAILFRGYAMLFAGDPLISPTDAFLNYLVVISLPVLAVYVTWKTFRYASPLVADAVHRASKTAVQAGVIAGLGYAAGSGAATTAARWGPKAGISQAAINRATGDSKQSTEQPTSGGTAHDNIATDASGGVPAYRRRENDPGYY